MAFSAVFWIERKNWSVISTSDIAEGSREPGCVAYATWRNKLYEVKVLRVSDHREELNNLNVSATGYIVTTRSANKALDSAKMTGKFPPPKESKRLPGKRVTKPTQPCKSPVYHQPLSTSEMSATGVSNEGLYTRSISPVKRFLHSVDGTLPTMHHNQAELNSNTSQGNQSNQSLSSSVGSIVTTVLSVFQQAPLLDCCGLTFEQIPFEILLPRDS